MIQSYATYLCICWYITNIYFQYRFNSKLPGFWRIQIYVTASVIRTIASDGILYSSYKVLYGVFDSKTLAVTLLTAKLLLLLLFLVQCHYMSLWTFVVVLYQELHEYVFRLLGVHLQVVKIHKFKITFS